MISSHLRAPGGFLRALVLGVILVCAARGQAPSIVEQPQALQVGPGDRAGFVVKATGATPLRYRWLRDGVAVAGATDDLMLIPAATTGDAGNYTVEVSNAQGVATSRAAKLEVNPYETQLVEVTYPDGNGVPLPLPLADGSLLVGREIDSRYNQNPALTRYLADGAADRSFVADLPQGWVTRVSVLETQADGKFLVGGGAGDESWRLIPFLVRLNADGSRDASFAPPALGGGVVAIVVTGTRCLVAAGTRIVRLNADGSVDGSFGFTPETDADGSEMAVYSLCADASGRLLAGIGGYLTRLSAEGARDVSFARIGLDLVWAWDVQPLPAGGLMLGWRTSQPAPGGSIVTGTFHLKRYTDAGLEDPSFPEFSFSRTAPADGGGFGSVAVQGDGRILVNGDFSSVRAGDNSTYARPGLVRLLPDGTVDTTFAALDLPEVYPGSAAPIRICPGGRQAIVGGGSLRRVRLDSVGAPLPPRILRVTAASESVLAGDDLPVKLVAVGTGPFTGENITWSNIQTPTGVFAVAGPGGTTMSDPIKIAVVPSAPHFSHDPESVVTSPGYSTRFDAVVHGSEPMRCEWFKDGVSLGEWERGFSIDRPNVSEADVGTYTLRVSNALGSAERSATLRIGPCSELVNLSARAAVGVGERVLIMGFVVRGDLGRGVYLRGVGPELARLGVTAPLADPRLHLLSTRGDDFVADNGESNWEMRTQLGATPLLDYVTRSVSVSHYVTGGIYTLEVSGVGGATGVALGEIYTTGTTTTRPVNLSARAYVGDGDNVLIAGFVIRGDKAKQILVRAVGPGLLDKGVGEALGNPKLTVVNTGTHETVATNDDWQSGEDIAGLRTTMARVGAFPLTEGSHDAAVCVTLEPGVCTAIVSGAPGTTGVALAEVYDADE